MRTEHSSISCGVRRLIIDKGEQPTAKDVANILKSNRNSCAMLVTAIPSGRKDIKTLLLDAGFEQVKGSVEDQEIIDPSVNDGLVELAALLMHHDHEFDAPDKFEQFISETISDGLGDMATMMLHHGTFVGKINFFVCCMKD